MAFIGQRYTLHPLFGKGKDKGELEIQNHYIELLLEEFHVLTAWSYSSLG